MIQRAFRWLCVLGLLACVPAWANLPSRVGRVVEVQGAAQFWDAEQRQWSPLFANRAVTAGDRVRSHGEARVRVEIGSLQVFIGPETDAEFSVLDDALVQLLNRQGAVALRVRQLGWVGQLELVSEELRLQPRALGFYRLDRLSAERRSVARVRAGLLQAVTASGAAIDIQPGRALEATGQGEAFEPVLAPSDGFTAWLASVEQSEPPTAGTAPVPELTGVEQLERHGRWETHPEFGTVWYPLTVRRDWEPYRDGRWVWVSRRGWTWIEDAPWGFAPFHYGRWLRWQDRWVWSPGSPSYRPAPIYGGRLGGGGTADTPTPGPGAVHSPLPRGFRPPDARHEVRPGWEERSMRVPRVEPRAEPRMEPRADTRPEPRPEATPRPQPVQPGQSSQPPRPERPERREGPDRRERTPLQLQ